MTINDIVLKYRNGFGEGKYVSIGVSSSILSKYAEFCENSGKDFGTELSRIIGEGIALDMYGKPSFIEKSEEKRKSEQNPEKNETVEMKQDTVTEQVTATAKRKKVTIKNIENEEVK